MRVKLKVRRFVGRVWRLQLPAGCRGTACASGVCVGCGVVADVVVAVGVRHAGSGHVCGQEGVAPVPLPVLVGH